MLAEGVALLDPGPVEGRLDDLRREVEGRRRHDRAARLGEVLHPEGEALAVRHVGAGEDERLDAGVARDVEDHLLLERRGFAVEAAGHVELRFIQLRLRGPVLARTLGLVQDQERGGRDLDQDLLVGVGRQELDLPRAAGVGAVGAHDHEVVVAPAVARREVAVGALVDVGEVGAALLALLRLHVGAGALLGLAPGGRGTLVGARLLVGVALFAVLAAGLLGGGSGHSRAPRTPSESRG